MLEKYSLKTQILILYSAISIISLVIIALLATGNITSIGDSTNEDATDALQNQIQTNMMKTSQDNALVIEQKFKNAEAAVRKIVSATETLFDPESTFGHRDSYRDIETESTLPDRYYDEEYQETISNTTSTYYYPTSELVGGQVTEEMNETIDRSAHLDYVFSSIFQDNREYVWLYVAFVEGGIFRNFPGAYVDPIDALYHPPTEDWFIEARDARGSLTYSPPYFDITQGLVVSLTQAVYVDGVFTAVVGLDFKTTTIQDKVLNVSFLESGYASLFQTSDYTLVAHPEWDSASHPEEEDIPIFMDIEKNSNGNPVFSNNELNEMVSGKSDVLNFSKNSVSYYLSYSPVLQVQSSDYQYVFVIIVKQSEILQPVGLIQLEILQSLSNARTQLLLISIVIISVILVLGLYIANNLIQPVQKLTQLAESITKNATKKDIFESISVDETLQSDDEIGDLTRNFSNMVQKLRQEQMGKYKKN
ncbi:MAG: cache domain-containing protein [Candidatus Heimdallarchaeota archaeon]|nr:cache domain-containing protein [Candidatus Heimdallarchaeota archaeon]MDH5645192.1 cache domain-containing protein [Candidatus Heimdallarchaeota archaeon]